MKTVTATDNMWTKYTKCSRLESNGAALTIYLNLSTLSVRM